jgi:hypothetical protein
MLRYLFESHLFLCVGRDSAVCLQRSAIVILDTLLSKRSSEMKGCAQIDEPGRRRERLELNANECVSPLRLLGLGGD